MTREEAIKTLANATIEPPWGGSFRATSEALDIAIEALKRERTDEWCTGCKEYDTEKKCCSRFNRVIRGAMEREPSEDGTLEVKVEDATKVGRVLISDDKHRGGLYYPDEYEPQGDLISRQAAIDALYDKGSSMTAWGELLAMKWSDIQKCIEQLPSADRPRGEWIEMGENKDGTHNIRCNQCGESFKARGHANSYNTKKKYRFCPHCGADMRATEGENDE